MVAPQELDAMLAPVALYPEGAAGGRTGALIGAGTWATAGDRPIPVVPRTARTTKPASTFIL